jgi:hypothetical protein
MEAERLAVYFEEMAAYQKRQLQESKSQPTTGGNMTEEVVLELGDEDDEE